MKEQYYKFNCKIITPMFCFGADGKVPELRVPSLKGSLRYWWRAIHPNLDNLREKETNIFGGAGGNEEIKATRSSFSMLIRSNISKLPEKIQALPHRTCYMKDCIVPGSTYDLIIRPKMEEIKKLLILTSILGGIGARSRRGFGCFRIESINGKQLDFTLSEDNILNLILSINPNFEMKNNNNRKYPYLQKVEIGKSVKDYNELLKKIGQASHDYDTPYTGTTDQHFVKSRRYASPIYISVYQENSEFYPIVSTLKRTIIDAKNHQDEENKKNNFVQAILGG